MAGQDTCTTFDVCSWHLADISAENQDRLVAGLFAEAGGDAR